MNLNFMDFEIPLLKALVKLGGKARPAEAYPEVGKIMGLNPKDFPVPFPFSDLSQSKRRPALVIASLEGNDAILCQITSKTIKDSYAISIDDTDFASGDP